MGKELWKVIPGFEDYLISNTGRVVHEAREIKGSDNGRGYKKVCLKQAERKRNVYIHRLVAESFLENPNNKPFVNHIDCNTNNNNVSNLEWCTAQENTDHMIRLGRNKRTQQWLDNLHKAQREAYTAVVGENIKTGEKIYFSKLNDVKQSDFQPSCVCDCCNGKRKQHKGYRWSYEEAI